MRTFLSDGKISISPTTMLSTTQSTGDRVGQRNSESQCSFHYEVIGIWVLNAVHVGVWCQTLEKGERQERSLIETRGPVLWQKLEAKETDGP